MSRGGAKPSARSPEFKSYFEAIVRSSKGLHEAKERLGYASPTTVLHHMKGFGIKSPDGWRPSANSPEFKVYFEGVVNTSQSMTEAVERLGYTRPQSVRYNLKRFGIKIPDRWYSQRDLRRFAGDSGFREHFEAMVNSSANVTDAMEKMGYAGPTSVRYHMKKLGIRTPDRWYGHPPAGGHEFAAHFENVVKTSKTVGEAVQRLGYANPSVIRHHLKRLGLEAPLEWGLKPGVSRQRRGRVPDVILKTDRDRAWVAALHQGEGCLTTHYSKESDTTALAIAVRMTDPAPIFKFCDLCGVGRPKKPSPRLPPWKPLWSAAIEGLRAFRVLQEILQDLTGQKLDEAKRALEFFAPNGRRKGRHGAYEVWPDDEFPLRKRSLLRYAENMNARLAVSRGELRPRGSGAWISLRLDRTCMRISDAVLDAGHDGLGLVEIMDGSGASWTAVIHHLKHLEDNFLIAKEKAHQSRGGPRLIYKANRKLLELRELGWIPDAFDGLPE